MDKYIIELNEVWKIYKMDEVEVPALRGLNFNVSKGEFVAILGPSGSGKSTALNMVGSLDIPTKGKIFLDGKDISKMDESNLAQLRGRKVGFIFQVFNLIPSLTAIENVMLPMTFQGKSREFRKKRAAELLRKVGLGQRMGHTPGQMSGGERQRVAIARALSNNPEVILADEPTGNLDSKTGLEVMELLKDLHVKEKRTIILVTHDEDLIKYTQRVCFLKDGKIIKTRRV